MTQVWNDPAQIAALKSLLGADAVRAGAAVEALHPGVHPDNLKAGIVVAPSTTQAVAAFVTWCRDSGVAIVPLGGRTGLVGGGTSHPGEIVLSLERMNQIERIDPIERVAVVGAGVTLEALQQAARLEGLEPGIDLAARGSATVGGMASTNAGGIMAFRNGVMRHRIFGIEAVMPTGEILSDLTRVVKVAAGYDIKHLLIGAEGTLGIITRLAIKLDPLPRAQATALIGCASVSSALRLVQNAMRREAGRLRMAEAMWSRFLHLTAAAHQFSDASVDLDQPVSVLLQLGGEDEVDLRAALEALFMAHLDTDPEASGTIAQTLAQERALLLLREDTDAIYRVHGAAPSYDVSVPQSELGAYVTRVIEELAALTPPRRPYVFGHVADGNLHIVMDCGGTLPPSETEAIEAIVYRDIAALGGSFSAEHGVGSKRMHSLLASVDPTKIAAMRAVKAALDPRRLFNPGKVLPEIPPSGW